MDKIVIKQYRDKVNQAVHRLDDFPLRPPEGWLKTVKKALGMTGPQLAERLGVSKWQVSKTEKGELAGSVKLETMQKMAEAMDCKFVYAVIPKNDVEQVIQEQARKKARKRVNEASTQMALEAQSLDKQRFESEIERIASELMDKMPSDFWSRNE